MACRFFARQPAIWCLIFLRPAKAGMGDSLHPAFFSTHLDRAHQLIMELRLQCCKRTCMLALTLARGSERVGLFYFCDRYYYVAAFHQRETSFDSGLYGKLYTPGLSTRALVNITREYFHAQSSRRRPQIPRENNHTGKPPENPNGKTCTPRRRAFVLPLCIINQRTIPQRCCNGSSNVLHPSSRR